MHILRLKLALPACVVLTLLLLVGTASANRLSSNEKGSRITYTPMVFATTTGRSVSCNVTLEGSQHIATIAKTRGALIGYITKASVASCTPANGARANTETLPWHIQYESFTGTLPNITSLTQNAINPSFEVVGEIFGLRVNCRYTFSSEPSINTREPRGGTITGQSIGNEFHLSSTGGCPEGRLEASNGVVRTLAGASVVVTLI